MGTTTRGAPYPEGGDPPDGPADIRALAEFVDFVPGISTLSYAQINAIAGAALWNGRRVYQGDTGTGRSVEGEYTYNGISWRRPWNMPWGIVTDPTVLTSDGTTYSAFVTVPGMAQTFTAVANRLIKITFTAPWHNGTATNGVQAKLLDGATQLTLVEQAPNAGTNGHLNVVYIGQFSVGSHTITPQVGHDVAGAVSLTVSSTRPAQMFIEDCGPQGSPT